MRFRYPKDTLTLTEMEVARRLADGQRIREIAREKNRSARTIDQHRMHIYSKLKIHSIAELVKWAVGVGLVQPRQGTLLPSRVRTVGVAQSVTGYMRCDAKPSSAAGERPQIPHVETSGGVANNLFS